MPLKCSEIASFVPYTIALPQRNLSVVVVNDGPLKLIISMLYTRSFILYEMMCAHRKVHIIMDTLRVLFFVTLASHVETAAPVWSNCPMNIEVNATTGSNNATVTWTEPTVSDDETPFNLLITDTYYSPELLAANVFLIGETEVRYVATDEVPLSSYCTFTVTVLDNQDPVIDGCPGDYTNTTEVGLPSSVVSWTSPTATDNSGVNPVEKKSYMSGSTFIIGTEDVIITFTDDSDNVATCQFSITINDEEAPTTSNCPTVDLEIIPGSVSSVSVNWDEPSFVDNSGETPSVTKTHNPGDFFDIGETIVVYNATDAYLNKGYCEINITVVQDTEAPVFTFCPSDTVVDTLENKNYSIVNFTVPVAIDNIQLLSVGQAITNYNPDGDIYYIGTTTIRYLALDEVNQPTYCTFSITVEGRNTQYFLPSSRFHLTVNITPTQLEKLDALSNRFVKLWFGMPRCATTVWPSFTCPRNLTFPTFLNSTKNAISLCISLPELSLVRS
ncbi:hyalin-like [Anneissia japonica]|uniref:hyalin-like n=1 Tax=Anneissia japonica TaxID=1529436 RepID=UPI001425503A|nr:hyalin-like [Anneissia japonica]